MSFSTKPPSILSKEDIQEIIKAKEFLLADKRKIFLNKEREGRAAVQEDEKEEKTADKKKEDEDEPKKDDEDDLRELEKELRGGVVKEETKTRKEEPKQESPKTSLPETKTKSPRDLKNVLWEFELAAGWVIILSLLSLFGIRTPYDANNTFALGTYQLNKDILLWGTILFLIITTISQLTLFVINPPGVKPKFKSVSALVYDFVLILAGVGAFAVLSSLFVTYIKTPVWFAYFLSSLITLTYDYFITKLFAYDKISDKGLFWEIVRFALVGVVSAVFDFSTTFGVRTILSGSGLNVTLITVIAVTFGFVVGVIINYLCSVSMVYKASKKSYAKTWYGVVIFVVLSTIGLFLGIGMEALFYDLLHWTYVLVFVLRTLAVMIWNYLSRKFILFK